MERYQHTQGNSGVAAYEIGRDRITVRFQDGGTYLYTYDSTGRSHVEQMKMLARQGAGLTTYISQHIRGRYAAKLR